jgi:ABC-type iron transport system FetAB ATPase subunit
VRARVCAESSGQKIGSPAGVGKNTSLESPLIEGLYRVVAGLAPPISGRILVGDRDVTALPPGARQIGYVPRGGALLPPYVSLNRASTDQFEFEKPYYAGPAHAPFVEAGPMRQGKIDRT